MGSCALESSTIPSNISPSDLGRIRKMYNIPESVILRAPEPEWRACAPPKGYGTLYLSYLEFGFRLPHHDFWEQLIAHYHVALGQITPSGVYYVIHFLVGCAKKNVTPTIDLFRYFFQMKKSPKTSGWFSINSRGKRMFKVRNPDSARKWKPSFMYFQIKDSGNTLSEEWRLGSVNDSWDEETPIPVGGKELDELGFQVSALSEEDLVAYGLSQSRTEELSKSPKKRKGKQKVGLESGDPFVLLKTKKSTKSKGPKTKNTQSGAGGEQSVAPTAATQPKLPLEDKGKRKLSAQSEKERKKTKITKQKRLRMPIFPQGSEAIMVSSESSASSDTEVDEVLIEAANQLQVNQVLAAAANKLKQRWASRSKKWKIDLADLTQKLKEKEAELKKKESELAERETELEKARANEKKSLLEATSSRLALEQEQSQQGEILKVVVEKLIKTKCFTNFINGICQVAAGTVRSQILSWLHDFLGWPTRRKELGWHPQAAEKASKMYAQKMLNEVPKFALLEHICSQSQGLTLENAQALDVDFDLSLTEDITKEIFEEFDDLDEDDSEDSNSEAEETEKGEVVKEEEVMTKTRRWRLHAVASTGPKAEKT